MERQMPAAEPSYFDFLMKHRSARRTRAPFAQRVGVTPDFTLALMREHAAPDLEVAHGLTPAAA
jgi:hypothetical protein